MTKEELIAAIRVTYRLHTKENRSALQVFLDENPLTQSVVPEAKAAQLALAQTVASIYGQDPNGVTVGGDYNWWIERIDFLYDYIDRAYGKVGYSVPVRHTVASLPTGSIDARVIFVPDSDDIVLAINEGLFIFFNYLIKICLVAMNAMSDEGRLNIAKTPNAAAVRSSMPSECRERFHDLMVSYILNGNAGAAEVWPIDRNYVKAQSHLLDASELFVLSHEHGHAELNPKEQAVELLEILSHDDDSIKSQHCLATGPKSCSRTGGRIA